VINRAPGGNGTGVDTNGDTAATDAQVGAHDTHLRSSNNYSSDIACNECHTVPAVSVAGIKGHLDGTPADMTWGTLATYNSASPGWTSPNCTNTYCHFGKSIGGYSPATANASVSWTNTAYLTGTPSLAGDCGKCHASPPATTGSHVGVNNINQCNGCHNHVTVTGTFSDVTKHINNIVEAQAECLGCHSSAKTGGIYNPRSVTADYLTTRTSRHIFSKNTSGTGTQVSSFDCVVCHMEGDQVASDASKGANAKASPSATYHNEGTSTATRFVNLRNVDTVTSGWQWTKNSTTTTHHKNMDDFCLSCHDSGGATGIVSTASGTKSTQGGSTAPTAAEALNPWSEASIPASGPTGRTTRTRVVDVNTQFNPGTYVWPAGDGTPPAGFNGTNYNGNNSQHAVRGPRYFTNNANWGTAAWVSTPLKSGQNMQTVREKAQLHCADCHTVDTNAHSAATVFMLTATGGTTFNGVTTNSAIDRTCFQCHPGGVYLNGSNTASRWNHTQEGDVWDAGVETKWNSSFCLTCHGGGRQNASEPQQFGGIHGVTGTDTISSQPRWRFQGGAYMSPNPDGTGNWTGTATSITCYFQSSANSMSNCTKHSGSTNRPWGYNYGRPTTY